MPNLISPNEIDVDTFIDNYLLNILVFTNVSDTSLIEIENDCQIKEAKDNNFKYIKLTKNDTENLSIIRLENYTFNYREYYLINKSYSFVQQKGYGTTLYEYCFCHLDLPIISDKVQTKAGSSNLWRKLLRKQNKNYEIFILNEVKKTEKRLSTSLSDYATWGVEEEIIEIFKDTAEISNDLLETNVYNGIDDDLYDPYTNIGENFLHEQLEKFIKDGLERKINKKRVKQRIKNRGYLRLIGKNSS